VNASAQQTLTSEPAASEKTSAEPTPTGKSSKVASRYNLFSLF
jgi:hypothetical protein